MPENGNYINGKWTASSGGTYDQCNPANLTEVTGQWPKSTVAETRLAIEAAENAFESWSGLTVFQRAEYLTRAVSLMKDRVDTIAEMITAENGKTLNESKMEINAAIIEAEFQINEGLRLGGEIMPSRQDGVLAYTIRRPLGAVSVICPWNFPFNVPGRKVTPALISGNTCVMKPANLTPGTGAEFVKLFEDAGLPPGVLNFISGSGAVVGKELVVNPAIKAISFTGSTEVGMGIHKKAADNLTRTQLEMGGKNPLVILADGDLEAAANAAATAAYMCAGQWCTSTSRMIVEKDVAPEVLEMIRRQVQKMVIGRGTDPKTTMGPVCGKSQYNDIAAGIEKGKAEGAMLVMGGSKMTDSEFAKGCYIEPTIFTGVTTEMFLAQEEIFGPVLSIMEADNFEQAVEMANAVRFGLASSIYTRDIQKAMTFVEKSDVGLTHVNMPTAHKEPQLTFGGVKFSGCGIPEAGHSGIEFFTEHKTAYIKYR